MSLLDELPKKIFDQTAETARELAAGCGMSHDWIKRTAKARCDEGVWEMVWKRVGGIAVPAYRKVANAKKLPRKTKAP